MPHPSTSSAYGIWSLNEVRDAVRGKNWPLSIAPWSVDLSNVTYDSVSFAPSVGSGTRDVVFNNDGTKMYIVVGGGDTVEQYSLTTPFDISTASYDSVSFSVASQDTNPQALVFNDTGTKMFLIGSQNDSVYQYSLSTAYDLSSASYDSVVLDVESEEAAPQGIALNNDGTKLYVIGPNGDEVNQYSLSTAYDLSTASFDSVTFDVLSQASQATGLKFNNVGTKLYIVGRASDSLYQYSLSTAYDMSTASYDNVSFNVSSQESVVEGLTFNNDGTKMYIIGSNGLTVHQYSTGL